MKNIENDIINIIKHIKAILVEYKGSLEWDFKFINNEVGANFHFSFSFPPDTHVFVIDMFNNLLDKVGNLAKSDLELVINSFNTYLD